MRGGGCPPAPPGWASAWPWSGCGTGRRGEIQGEGGSPPEAGGDSAPRPQVARGPLPRAQCGCSAPLPPAPGPPDPKPFSHPNGSGTGAGAPHILRGVSPRAPISCGGVSPPRPLEPCRTAQRRVRPSPARSVARKVVLRRASPSIVGGNFIMPVKGKGRWRAPSKGPRCGPLAALDRHEARRSTNERRSRQ